MFICAKWRGIATMRKKLCFLALLSHVLFIAACSSEQARYTPLGSGYPPLPNDYPVEIFRYSLPDKSFERIARLDVHLEKSNFRNPSFEETVPKLIDQARLSGSHAIIEVKERRSSLIETQVYHVTATGIRYVDQ